MTFQLKISYLLKCMICFVIMVLCLGIIRFITVNGNIFKLLVNIILIAEQGEECTVWTSFMGVQ